MAEVGLAEVWATLQGIMGGIGQLSDLIERQGKTMELSPPAVDRTLDNPSPRFDPMVKATMDQVHAGLRELSGQVELWRTTPPSVSAPPISFDPIASVLKDVQETMAKLPQMLNIRIGSGGLGTTANNVGLLSPIESGAQISPAEEQTLRNARDSLATLVTLLTGGITVTVPQSQAYLNDGSIDDLYQRLMNPRPRPAPGYAIWFDTADTSFIYTLEALTTKTTSQTGFRGLRHTLSSGVPVGKIQYNLGGTLTFTNRATDGGWV